MESIVSFCTVLMIIEVLQSSSRSACVCVVIIFLKVIFDVSHVFTPVLTRYKGQFKSKMFCGDVL